MSISRDRVALATNDRTALGREWGGRYQAAQAIRTTTAAPRGRHALAMVATVAAALVTGAAIGAALAFFGVL